MQDRAYFLHHLHFPNFRTCNGNSTGNVLCPDLKSDISFYASAGNLAFLPVLWIFSFNNTIQHIIVLQKMIVVRLLVYTKEGIEH